MDVRQVIFPFIMAVITNSLMIVMIYFLRKIPWFANLFGVWSMVALYLFGVLRMFLPIELPGIQVVIRDNTVYNSLIESLIKRSPEGPGSMSALFYIIIGLWLFVAAALGISFIHSNRAYRTYVLANSDDASDSERAMLKAVTARILGSDKNISLRKSDAVSGIMVIGLRRKCVLLPEGDYPPDRLEMILTHECMHIKNKDLWLKLLIRIYCCIFWWNPFSYLLMHDLSFSLEMKCDLSVVRSFSDDEVLLYLNTIHSCAAAQRTDESLRRAPFLVCAELSDARKSRELVKRVKAITADPPKKAGVVTVTALAASAMAAIFALSYIFILQPYFGVTISPDKYDAPKDVTEDSYIADETNSYLVKQEDGNYLLYIESFQPIPVPKEEVEEGLYNGYPILENSKENPE